MAYRCTAGGSPRQGAGHGASVGGIVGGVVGGIAVALLLGDVVYFLQRRRRKRSTDMRVKALSASGHRPSMHRLLSGTGPPTGNVSTLGFSTSPPAFVPGSEAATIAAKSSRQPSSADTILTAPSPTDYARIESNMIRTAPRDAPYNNTQTVARNGSNELTDQVIGLRAEMENLKRVVQDIHIQVERGTGEAPPEYVA